MAERRKRNFGGAGALSGGPKRYVPDVAPPVELGFDEPPQRDENDNISSGVMETTQHLYQHLEKQISTQSEGEHHEETGSEENSFVTQHSHNDISDDTLESTVHDPEDVYHSQQAEMGNTGIARSPEETRGGAVLDDKTGDWVLSTPSATGTSSPVDFAPSSTPSEKQDEGMTDSNPVLNPGSAAPASGFQFPEDVGPIFPNGFVLPTNGTTLETGDGTATSEEQKPITADSAAAALLAATPPNVGGDVKIRTGGSSRVSVVWNFFVQRGLTAECRLCLKQFRFTGPTSPLLYHLKRTHGFRDIVGSSDRGGSVAGKRALKRKNGSTGTGARAIKPKLEPQTADTSVPTSSTPDEEKTTIHALSSSLPIDLSSKPNTGSSVFGDLNATDAAAAQYSLVVGPDGSERAGADLDQSGSILCEYRQMAMMDDDDDGVPTDLSVPSAALTPIGKSLTQKLAAMPGISASMDVSAAAAALGNHSSNHALRPQVNCSMPNFTQADTLPESLISLLHAEPTSMASTATTTISAIAPAAQTASNAIPKATLSHTQSPTTNTSSHLSVSRMIDMLRKTQGTFTLQPLQPAVATPTQQPTPKSRKSKSNSANVQAAQQATSDLSLTTQMGSASSVLSSLVQKPMMPPSAADSVVQILPAGAAYMDLPNVLASASPKTSHNTAGALAVDARPATQSLQRGCKNLDDVVEALNRISSSQTQMNLSVQQLLLVMQQINAAQTTQNELIRNQAARDSCQTEQISEVLIKVEQALGRLAQNSSDNVKNFTLPVCNGTS